MFSTTVRGGKTFTAEQETSELKKKNIQVNVFGRELSGSKSPMKNLCHIDLTFAVKLLNKTSI